MLTFQLYSFPPSVNAMYLTRGRHRVLTPAARGWKAEAAIALAEQLEGSEGQLEALVGQRLSVSVKLYSDRWWCKNGNVRKVDCSSYEKCLIDSVFAALGIDDSHIFDLQLCKVVDDFEWIEIAIEAR
jgi:Holliday junction resolvase RusA-like endonuclease